MKTTYNVDPKEVKALIDEVSRTKMYDRKVISEFHDRIFGKDDRPESVDPCPVMQMRKIKAWYQDQKNAY